MVQRVEMPSIDLAPLDELIAARRSQWKDVGTPQTLALALNKSCILTLSALLQGYIEEVFFTVSSYLLLHLDDEDLDAYRQSVGNWGNPNPGNIERLFIRIGVARVIDKVTRQRTNARRIKAKLTLLNEQRNKIAHGKEPKGPLKLSHIERMRDFAEQFSINLNRYLANRFRRNLNLRLAMQRRFL